MFSMCFYINMLIEFLGQSLINGVLQQPAGVHCIGSTAPHLFGVRTMQETPSIGRHTYIYRGISCHEVHG